MFERSFGIAESTDFGIRARGIGPGAAHFGLAESVCIAHNAFHPDA